MMLIASILNQLYGPLSIYHAALRNISAAELELITLAKLEISAILQQRHLSVSAADIVVTAMQSLQESELFKEVKKQQVVRR